MSNNQLPAYKDTSLSFEERARDLIGRMTLEEKIWQMVHSSPAIKRLDVPEYNWWNECLHGVARAGIATVFPQAIGMAATWNVDLIKNIADAISDEARARYHAISGKQDRGKYKGLTYWSPNINIFRDPRWGRGQETYGEDPYLTGRMGVAFCKGLQGSDPKYLKLVATPKHYAVHSGPEKDRHHFDAISTPKDLWETYLPAFEECIVEAGAWSIMGAYNRTNHEPCCASRFLLGEVLRKKWGFKGFVVSDCGAICDIHANHKVTETPAQSAALAVKEGCDLCCGDTYVDLVNAVKEGLVTEQEIDTCLVRLFTARFKLGMFDPDEMVPFSKIPFSVNDSPEHRAIALEAARQSIVLLKNDGVLPLSRCVKSIAVIGPNINAVECLLGNYSGSLSKYVTPLQGIWDRAGADIRVVAAHGCKLTGDGQGQVAEALLAAEESDVVVFVGGISPRIEGEEGEVADSDGGGDRIHINLPGIQEELLKKLKAVGKPVILVLMGGSPIAVNWAQENLDAMLMAWYPGEEGGTAIAEALFGDFSPSGRLPVTFPKTLDDLPPFTDYSMRGRTYRYMTAEPLYPFGFGLSYTTFAYSGLTFDTSTLTASVDVANTGKTDSWETVQFYLTDLESSVETPVRKLVGFSKVFVKAGEKTVVSCAVTRKQLSLIDNEGNCVFEPGRFKLTAGGSQGDSRSLALGAAPCQSVEFEMM